MLHFRLDGIRRGNTVAGSRRNIEEHYDAGNAMYSLFLDETLTYSSGIHNPGVYACEAPVVPPSALPASCYRLRSFLTCPAHLSGLRCRCGSAEAETSTSLCC